MTNNWSAPIFNRGSETIASPYKVDVKNKTTTQEEAKPSFWKSNFGTSAGIDPRARAIEKRLGL